MTTRTATATAPANFALSKYWGKTDDGARHPAVPSVSACIRGLSATTTVTFRDDLDRDTATLNGETVDPSTGDRLDVVLDAVRARAGLDRRAHVESRTNFPVKAGLASSAAGLAAVAAAAWKAAGLDATDLDAIADIARTGSGSACRSVHGGFVAWEPFDGGSRVRHVAPASHWPLEMCLVRVHTGPKEIGSTEGMRRAMQSPVWPAWVETAARDAQTIEAAIRAKDFGALAQTAEANCLLMHATTITARPPFFYFRGETFTVIEVVQRLRAERQLPVFFTIDAGPNVKVFCEPGRGEEVARALAGQVPAGLAVDRYAVGDGVVFED